MAVFKFIIELLIYVFFAWAMYSLAKESILCHKNSMKFDGYIWCYVLFFTIISAIRWRVGVDSASYIEIFRDGVVRDGSKEYIWDWLVLLIHHWGLHFVIGTAIMAFLQIFFLCKGFQQYKYILIWFPVVLFGGRYYLGLMNGVRQMTVACVYVFLVKYIIERKPLPFLTGVLLLYGIHNSALLLLPTYLLTYIPFKKLPNRRILCLAILLVCFAIGQTPSLQGLFKYVEQILFITGYDNYTDFYSNVLEGQGEEQLAFGPTMISFLLCSVVLVWYAPELQRTYGKVIPYFNLWYFFAVFYSCGYFLVCNISHMMIRPFQYFELFQAIMLALLLHYFSINKKRYQVHLYALIFLIWVCTIIGIYKACNTPIEFTIYKTFFGRY